MKLYQYTCALSVKLIYMDVTQIIKKKEEIFQRNTDNIAKQPSFWLLGQFFLCFYLAKSDCTSNSPLFPKWPLCRRLMTD